ncbi:HAD family hydrolase [Halosimplex halophilum]|uniref:HAD family hydrolase n=1 Tax=Halosimplex halophilum TaxID=2559572 RepID=UPI00107EFB5E|nr:HAD family hydrolase [Halosimplex halophilum]
MGEFDAVCFDLDSTLCVAEQSDAEIHAAVFDRVGLDPLFSPADVRAVDATDLPTAHSDREFYEHLYRAVCADVGADRAHAPELAEATVEVVDETAVSFREGAREALDHVRERHEVGLVTNGGEATQTAKLERLGVADAFDATVFCDPANGVEPKPDTEPFERVLADLDAPAGRTLYVGDSHGADVVGAHAAGLHSAWVPLVRHDAAPPADPDPAPTHRLDGMAELPDVL